MTPLKLLDRGIFRKLGTGANVERLAELLGQCDS